MRAKTSQSLLVNVFRGHSVLSLHVAAHMLLGRLSRRMSRARGDASVDSEEATSRHCTLTTLAL